MARKGQTHVAGPLVKRYVRLPARSLSPRMTQRLIETREKQSQALELRKAGMTYEEIAKAVGYKDASGARYACKAAIERIGVDAAIDVVEMDLVRLDEFQRRLTAEMRAKNDISVIPMIMNVMRERRALLGVSDETIAESIAEKKGAGITNNGVMVISGNTADMVKGMMLAVGVDPNSEEAQKRLAAIQKEEEKKGTGEYALAAPRPNQLALGSSADNALNLNEGNVISGEVVRSVLSEEDV